MADPRVITAYDERPDAEAPGPTVDAVLAGTLAGAVGAVAQGAGAWPPGAALGAVAGLAALAGVWSGRTGGRRGGRLGALAGAITGVWAVASTAMPDAIERATATMTRLAPARDTLDDATLLVLGGGVSDAISACVSSVVVAVALGAACGAVAGRLTPHGGRSPRALDGQAAEWALRTGVQLQALLALLLALATPRLARFVGAMGELGSMDTAMWAWETTLHTSAALAALFVIRAVWRLPRTAPETRVRVVADGLGVVVLALAFAAFRVEVRGGPLTWIGPLVPWVLAGVFLRVTGRPAPPPVPSRGPLPVTDALAFGALIAATLAILGELYVTPGLVIALGVLPWTAAAGDPTADLPIAAPMLIQAQEILSRLGVRLFQVGLGVAAVAWGVRAAGARWIGARVATSGR